MKVRSKQLWTRPGVRLPARGGGAPRPAGAAAAAGGGCDAASESLRARRRDTRRTLSRVRVAGCVLISRLQKPPAARALAVSFVSRRGARGYLARSAQRAIVATPAGAGPGRDHARGLAACGRGHVGDLSRARAVVRRRRGRVADFRRRFPAARRAQRQRGGAGRLLHRAAAALGRGSDELPLLRHGGRRQSAGALRARALWVRAPARRAALGGAQPPLFFLLPRSRSAGSGWTAARAAARGG